MKTLKERLEHSMKEVNEKRKGQINAMMEPQFIRCDEEEMWAEFRFPKKEWERNIAGHLHGGVTAAMFDFSMGVLIRDLTELKFVPTVELNVTYMRAVKDEDGVIVKAKVEKMGKRIIHLSAEMFLEKDGKKAAMARGMFLNENTS